MNNLSRYARIAVGAAALSLFPGAMEAADNPVTLYGVKIYCEGGGSSGLYSVEATPGAQPQLCWSDGDMIGNAGVVYADGTMYVLTYLDFYGMEVWSYLTCDVENKTYDFAMPEYLEFTDVGSASTYDPATGNVYTICIDGDDTSQVTLSTMDVATAKKTPVSRISRMAALAADRQGTLYGIGMDGVLYKIDKHTAATTAVGSTGLVPNVNNTAVIDYATGVMYWNAYTEDGGALYTVDVTTAEATLVTKFDPSFQFDGLFIKQTAQNDGAPEQPTGVSANFEGGSLAGDICFVMPSVDVDGGQLTGELAYKVSVAGKVLSEGTGMPGSEVKAPVEVDRRGNYQFLVEVSNDSGTARPSTLWRYVGLDDPKEVENLTVTIDGMVATLTWDLPETGVNGGYIDPEDVKYVIVRGPYEKLMSSDFRGNTYMETLDWTGVEPLMYGVHAYVDESYVTDMVFSNIVTVGEFVTVPYEQDFTDIFRQLVFTAFDNNGDQCTWMYDQELESMVCNWPLADTSDDWFVSPAIMLEAGETYRTVATVRSEGKWNYTNQEYEDVFAGNLSISLGSEADPSAMTTVLLEPTEVYSKELHDLSSGLFTVPVSGKYYVGLHHSGPRSIYYTLLNKLVVKAEAADGVTSVEASEAFTATAVDGGIAIENPAGMTVSVVAMDGRNVATVTSRSAIVNASPGVYLVVSAGVTTKVAVR